MGNCVAEQKMQFLWAEPEMGSLREAIRDNLGLDLSGRASPLRKNIRHRVPKTLRRTFSLRIAPGIVLAAV